MINYILIGFVIFPIIFGLIQYIIKKFNFKFISLGIQLFILLVTFMVLFISDYKMGIVVPLLNIPSPVGMVLKLDELSMVMLLLNNIIFFTMAYASYHREYYNKLFIFLICALQGLINGVFLSTDFFNVYLLIELATIVVSILVMYKKDGRSLYDGMLYLIVNMVGMAFFLMGVGYLYKVFGVLDFESIGQMITQIPQKSLVLPFAFLITGASLKSAFMPLFSWLPKAHGTASAPTIVSAILSGIFVKTGIYIFIRTTTLFAPVINLADIFFVVAILTAVLGAIFAMSHTDIKLIMSYSTISQVGIIMLGLNNVSATSYTGGVFYLFNHGIFKVLMFFCVGLIIKMYNTRNIKAMDSLWSNSKIVSIGYVLGVLSLTGFPLLGSGIGKYMISTYYETDVVKMLFMMLTVTTSLYCIPLLKILLPKSSKVVYKIKSNQRNTIIILSGILITLGVFYTPILNILFDYDLIINVTRLMSKMTEYGILIVLAVVLNLLLNRLDRIKEWIKGFDLSFNAINFAILSYFIMIVFAAQI